MADLSRADRFIINHPDATIAELQHTIAKATGLEDAIEVSENEELKLNVRGNYSYALHLSHKIQREMLYVSSYVSVHSRRQLIDAFLGINKAQRDQNLRNIIASRMTRGTAQAAWQYRCHPLLCRLVEISGMEPDKFIATLKGHIGQFRTFAGDPQFSDGRRRSYAKLLFPIEFEAKGGSIILDKIDLGDGVEIAFSNNDQGQAPYMVLPGEIIPESICSGLIGQSVGNLIDNLEITDLLSDEIIRKIDAGPKSTVISFDHRNYAQMAEGGEIIDQEYERIIGQLYAWAEKDPFPINPSSEKST